MATSADAMKYISFLLLFFFPFAISFAQTTLNDTTFFVREFQDGHYHAIFIEPNKHAETYNLICTSSFNDYDSLSYTQSLKDADEQQHNSWKHFEIKNICTNWIPLYSYKGNHYVYLPSDYGNINNFLINDSTTIQFNMDGPWGFRTLSFEKAGKDSYTIIRQTYDGMVDTLLIHPIDNIKGAAVFEFRKEGNAVFSLMLKANAVRHYPLIINYSEYQKQMEFQFDTIEFKNE